MDLEVDKMPIIEPKDSSRYGMKKKNEAIGLAILRKVKDTGANEV